jgi:Mor family transcriptional regulator
MRSYKVKEPLERYALAQMYAQGGDIKELCQRYSISPRTLRRLTQREGFSRRKQIYEGSKPYIGPAWRFDALAEEEKEAERLVTDTISIMEGHERMTTSELVQGLRALPTSPWRTYRGSGITDDASGAMLLASLLKHFGVRPKTIRVKPKGEANSTAKGYRYADLIVGAEEAGLPLVGKEAVARLKTTLPSLPDPSRNEEIARRYATGEPSRKLAKDYHLTVNSIRRISKNAGVAPHKRGPQSHHLKLNETERDKLVAEYLACRNASEVAAKNGVSLNAVYRAAWSKGISTEGRQIRSRDRFMEIVEDYKLGLTVEQIMAKRDLCYTSVYQHLYRVGIKRARTDHDMEMKMQDAVIIGGFRSGKDQGMLMEDTGLTRSCIQKLLHKAGVTHKELIDSNWREKDRLGCLQSIDRRGIFWKERERLVELQVREAVSKVQSVPDLVVQPASISEPTSFSEVKSTPISTPWYKRLTDLVFKTVSSEPRP